VSALGRSETDARRAACSASFCGRLEALPDFLSQTRAAGFAFVDDARRSSTRRELARAQLVRIGSRRERNENGWAPDGCDFRDGDLSRAANHQIGQARRSGISVKNGFTCAVNSSWA